MPTRRYSSPGTSGPQDSGYAPPPTRPTPPISSARAAAAAKAKRTTSRPSLGQQRLSPSPRHPTEAAHSPPKNTNESPVPVSRNEASEQTHQTGTLAPVAAGASGIDSAGRGVRPSPMVLRGAKPGGVARNECRRRRDVISRRCEVLTHVGRVIQYELQVGSRRGFPHRPQRFAEIPGISPARSGKSPAYSPDALHPRSYGSVAWRRSSTPRGKGDRHERCAEGVGATRGVASI